MKARNTSLQLLLLSLACLCFSKPASGQQTYPPSETITYQSFDNGTLTLRAFSGRHVKYALPNSWLEGGGTQGLTPAELVSLIERSDAVYEKMADIVGGEPKGTGLMLIPVTPLSSAEEGLAVAGTKRLEIAERIRDRVKVALAEGRLHYVITHEIAHCFAIYTPYFHYYLDAGHAWTDFWIDYSEYLLHTGPYKTAPELKLRTTVANFTRKWDSLRTSATWARCVKPGTGCEAEGIIANRVYAGLLLRYASLHGREAVKRAFEFYRNYNATHDPLEVFNFTAEQKNDLLAEALSFGISADISGELDAWFWPLSQATREKLRLTYSQPNPFAQDADGDGWSPARGDLDDHDPHVHPGATEIVNGRDDDCNGLVDDVRRTAGPTLFTLPARLTGRLAPEQIDTYRFEGAGTLLIRTYSDGWYGHVGIKREGEAAISHFIGFTPGVSTLSEIRLEGAGPWELIVIATIGSTSDYEVLLAPSPLGETGAGAVFALPLRAPNSPQEHALASNGLARAVGTLPGANAAAAHARPDGQGRWPTVLSGIEVRVAGQAATVLAVRPGGGGSYSVDFVVPAGVTPAAFGARIPLVVRHTPSGAQWRLDGAELLDSAPALWGREAGGQSVPSALALNSPTLVAFDEINRVPPDGNTRIMLFASGLGLGRTSGNTRLVAQLADGSRMQLPVEHVGDTSLPGIQQIIFKVDAALFGQPRVLVSVEGQEQAWVALYVR
ncbi:MAG TPA: MopE-related protein [Pyrinomonadaceae bacterium]|nr:MopE-related protein [Pyrinomonadaceae bacterium]